MADHCHNLIEIIGNDAALEEVNRWKELLNTFKPTDQDPHCMRAIKAVFYPELTQDDNWICPRITEPRVSVKSLTAFDGTSSVKDISAHCEDAFDCNVQTKLSTHS